MSLILGFISRAVHLIFDKLNFFHLTSEKKRESVCVILNMAGREYNRDRSANLHIMRTT